MASDSLRTQFTVLPAYKLKGHQAAVLCCAPTGSRIASGAEDGRLLLHDLRSAPSAASAAGGSTTSDNASCTSAAKPLSTIALTGPDGQPAAVAALAVNPTSPETSIFAAAGSLVHHVDLRAGSVVQTYGSSREEVNGLCVSGRGVHLAAGDDAGEVQVYDLAAGRLFKSIRNVHRSICSSVAFRAHKPWDLLTGGLDSTVAKYDFSRPKCVDRWDMAALAAGSGAPGGAAAATSGGGGGGQLFNPPFVHQVAVPPGDARPTCQWAAAARGDGAVVVLDADVSSAASGSSGPTTPLAAAAGSRGTGRGGGASRGSIRAVGSSGGGGGGGGGGPMRPLVLDRDLGGHTMPVCSVAFAPCSAATAAAAAAAAASEAPATAAGCRLYSGGEDCRVILWDVGGALAARAAGLPLVGPAAAAAAAPGDVGREAGEAEAAAVARGAEASASGGGGAPEEGEGKGEEEGEGQEGGRVAVLAEVRHGRKVNQLCCTELDGAELVAVAAVSKFVVVYRTQTGTDL
ncbi:hypothetical protein PLESTB_000041300 [Pleodorina starrii]|uniref:Uncharacterized protein n=1 Tax=Pleodorina starrii TaxID=330485 RepID=A0A9W6BA10_9CHLO|nr:hypothetical protein PLESTB_000041300 [Pleodorina starrii]